MTQTIISLLSILAGIIGANVFGVIFKEHSFDVIGHSIAGVFGSIFVIKSLGRLGFDPNSIMETGEVNTFLFVVNIFISLIGGGMAVFMASKIEKGMNKS